MNLTRKDSASISIFIIIVMIAAAIWLGWAITHYDSGILIYGALFIPGIILVFSSPKVAVVLMIISLFSIEWLASMGILPPNSIYTIDGLSLLIFSRVIFLRFQMSGKFMRSPILILILLWVVWVVVSGIVNSTPIIQIVLGMRVYIRFVLIYFSMLEFDWDQDFLKKCIILIVVLFIIQVPIMVYQRSSGLFGIDSISGTMSSKWGGTGTISILAMIFFSGLVSYGIFSGKKIPIIISLSLLSIPIMATARAFVLITPAVVGYTIFRVTQKKMNWQFMIVIAGMFLVFSNWSVQGLHNPGVPALEVIQNPGILLEEVAAGPVEGTEGSSVGRLTALQLTWDRIIRAPTTFALGYGPAAAQGSRYSNLQSTYFLDLAMSGGRSSQLTRSLMEWGLLGTATYILLFLILWLRTEKVLLLAQTPFWKSIAFGHALACILMMFMSTYTSVWASSSVSFMVWFVAGCLHRMLNDKTVSSESGAVG